MQSGQRTPSLNEVETILADYQKGNLNPAYSTGLKLVEQYPTFPVLHNILGAICAKKGDQQQAVKHFSDAVRIDPNFPDAYNNMGVALKSLGRLQEAVESYGKAISIKLDYVDAHFNLANVLRDMGRREEAAAQYSQALRLAPNHYGARNNLGVLLNKLERYEEAAQHFEKVVAVNPHSFECYNNLGLAYKNLHHEEKAFSYFTKAIEIKPDYAQAHYNLGNYFFDLGRKEEAVSSYETALNINPRFSEVYRSLTAVKRVEKDDAHVSFMQKMLNEENLPNEDRMQICFALGKVFEGDEDYDRAFQYYSEANALRKEFLGYSPDIERRMFQNVRAAFADSGPHRALDRQSLEQRPFTPIFIVGMPRSGTSLTEHILASHSQIYGAGELMTLGKAVTSIWSGGDYGAEQLKQIRRYYLEDLKKRGAHGPFVTDKMHMNYRWIGFICTAFPDAKIVHIKRRSIASCWSIFKHYFTDFGNGYAYNLDDVVEYYTSYMDLMKFWEERFPGAVYNLSYERLTEDQEFETRNLLEHLGLPFEQSCIDFHETKRAVATISALQVRKKLYKGSSEEWRKYEKFLGPLIERLGVD